MWAHSVNADGERHALSEHARSTARLARRFANEFHASDLGYALGLFHDVGKARPCWQEGLIEAETRHGSVGRSHKDLGARLLRPTAGPAAMAIQGHHGGLCTLGELRDIRPLDPELDDEALRRFLTDVEEASAVLDAEPNSLIPTRWRRSPLIAELGIRLAFSALVDADHLDTAAHFDGLPSPTVRPDADMASLRDLFESGRERLLADRAASRVDEIRERVYRSAVEYAGHSPGIFRMPAPTGVGKTLSAAGFALHHAAAHGKRRVIVAVPFVTITEQNAQIYRSLLGAGTVLEHHSGVRPADRGTDELRLRSGVENWDSPFVVTTTVQLFDSLFGRKPAQMRKVHRLANAVVVLDEVQALPLRVLVPILDALRTLCEEFGTTVLLTSATQPSFEALDIWNDIPVTDIVDRPRELFRTMRRVRYQWWLSPRPTLAQVAAEAGKHEQVLTVVNTTGDARTLYRLWADDGLSNVFHLSTRMYPEHRRSVLARVRTLLAEGEPVRLVSTQLIEAGVDVDFPVVYRAMAPAEALQQAAGRANREGHLGEGLVVIFDADDMSAPAGYRIGTKVTGEFFGPHGNDVVDPDDLQMLDQYYKTLYRRSDADNGARATTIQKHRANFDFMGVTDGPRQAGGITQTRDPALAFRMLDDDTVPVVVTDDDVDGLAAALVAKLREAPEQTKETLRELQRFVVALPRRSLSDPAIAALCAPLIGDLHEWRGAYDSNYGIDTSDLKEEEVW